MKSLNKMGKSIVRRDYRLDIVFSISVLPCCVGRKPLPSFSPRELECLPVSLSNAIGMFEYSGQEVRNTLPHLLYSFAHGVISSPSTWQLCKSSREKSFLVTNLYFPHSVLKKKKELCIFLYALLCVFAFQTYMNVRRYPVSLCTQAHEHRCTDHFHDLGVP